MGNVVCIVIDSVQDWNLPVISFDGNIFAVNQQDSRKFLTSVACDINAWWQFLEFCTDVSICCGNATVVVECKLAK